jgi:hypothetical protein
MSVITQLARIATAILLFSSLHISAQEQVIFHHDFSDSRIGWWTGTNQDIRAELRDSNYILTTLGNSDQIIANALSNDFEISGDVGIECEISPVSGPDNAAIGIVWDFTDAANFAYFFVDKAGYFQHGFVVRGEWKNAISWTSAENIFVGSGANRLKIRSIGPNLIYYINDQMVSTSLRIDDLPRTHKAGFYVGRSMSIQVSRLIFWEEPDAGNSADAFCSVVTRVIGAMDTGFRTLRGRELPEERTYLTAFSLPKAFYSNVSFLAWPTCNFIFYRGESEQIAKTIFDKILEHVKSCEPSNWLPPVLEETPEPTTLKSYTVTTTESATRKFKGKAITLKLNSYVWGHQVELKFVNFDIRR